MRELTHAFSVSDSLDWLSCAWGAVCRYLFSTAAADGSLAALQINDQRLSEGERGMPNIDPMPKKMVKII